MSARADWREGGRCAICPSTDLISARQRGTLTAPESARIDRHLTWCPECQHDVAGLLFVESPPPVDFEEFPLATIGERWQTLPLASVGEIRLLNPSRLPFPELVSHVPAVIVTAVTGRMLREVTPISLAPYYSGPGDWVFPEGIGHLPWPAMIACGVSVPLEQRVLGARAGRVDAEAVLLIRKISNALRNEPFELPQVPGPPPRWSSRGFDEAPGDYVSHVRDSLAAPAGEARAVLGIASDRGPPLEADAPLPTLIQTARSSARVRADVRIDEDGVTVKASCAALQLGKDDVRRLDVTHATRAIGVFTTPQGRESQVLVDSFVVEGDTLWLAFSGSVPSAGWLDVLLDP